MKIAIDSRAALWYRGSGMGTYSYQLIRNLYLIDKKNDYSFMLPESLGMEGADPINSGIFQSIAYTKELFWEALLEEAIEPKNCDIYHIPHNGIGFPTKKTCPTVVTIHDLIPYVMPETVGKGYLSIFLRDMPQIVEQADHIIAVSKHTKQDLINILGVSESKITAVYEAAENIYKPINKQLTQNLLQKKYNLNKPYVLYLGGFSPRKNVAGLITAFAELCQNLPGYTLVIAGRQSPNLMPLIKQIESLNLTDRVNFLGFVPMQDLPYLYNGAALFVYPSLYEGFGLPPLEAMSCGTPTIVSDVSSLPEIVGEGAKAVNPADCHALAATMYELLNDNKQAKQLGLKGERQANQYSWTKAAAQTLKVYEKYASFT